MPGFLEVESLGPLRTVEPGGFAEQTEVWELYNVTLADTEPEMLLQLAAIGLPM